MDAKKLSFIQRHYSEMDNDKLLRILKYEYDNLEYEIKELAKSEAEKRGILSIETKFLINRQEDVEDEREIKSIAIAIQSGNCPLCHKSLRLNGILNKRYGLILMCPFRIYKFRIACKECQLKEAKKDIIYSILLSVFNPLFILSVPVVFLLSYWNYRKIIKIDFEIPTNSLIQHVKYNVKSYRDIIINS